MMVLKGKIQTLTLVKIKTQKRGEMSLPKLVKIQCNITSINVKESVCRMKIL